MQVTGKRPPDRKTILKSFAPFALELTQGWIPWTATRLWHRQERSHRWCWPPGCLAAARGISSGQHCGQWWAGEQVHPAPPPSGISCLERERQRSHRSSSQGCFIKAKSFLVTRNFFTLNCKLFFFSLKIHSLDMIELLLEIFQYSQSSLCKTKQKYRKNPRQNSAKTQERRYESQRGTGHCDSS